MNEVKTILSKIKSIENFPEYTEFFLTKTYNLNGNKKLKNMINEGNKHIKKRVYLYNEKTHLFNNIGVIDIEGTRYIDFDDNWHTLKNIQTCNQTTQFIK